MRVVVSLLLLVLTASADPPLVKDFRRIRDLKDDVQKAIVKRQEEEKEAAKPREEKMVLAFLAGAPKFEGKRISGRLVVTTCLKWADVQQETPTEAGQRVLDLLPEVLRRRYAAGIEIPKDRREVSNLLLDALDSDFLHVRRAAVESLKSMYKTATYDPAMSRMERAESIETWRKYVVKQNNR